MKIEESQQGATGADVGKGLMTPWSVMSMFTLPGWYQRGWQGNI